MQIYFVFVCFSFTSLKLIKDHCLSFIVKDDNYNNIVMTSDFETLDKPLMVEIVRKRVYPGRMNDIRNTKSAGEKIWNLIDVSKYSFWHLN